MIGCRLQERSDFRLYNLQPKKSWNSVAILNPDHLFDQADKLIAPPPHGPSRQVDLRRAISSAYYGAFHAVLAAVANRFIGSTKQSTSLYSLVYRSIDHQALRNLCLEVTKPNLSPKYIPHIPTG